MEACRMTVALCYTTNLFNSRQYEHIRSCTGKDYSIVLRRKIIKSICCPFATLLPILNTSCYRGLQLSHRTMAPLNCSMGSRAYYGPIRDNKSGLLFFIEFQELLTFPNVPMATCSLKQRRVQCHIGCLLISLQTAPSEI